MSKKQIVLTSISALALVAVMVIIFLFSGQGGASSTSSSDSVGEVVLDVLNKPIPEGESPSNVPIVFNFNIRKCAHVFMFAMLGLTSFLFFLSLFSGIKRTSKSKLILLFVTVSALTLSFGYACFDELHQKYVGGRVASFSDVGIDAIGFVTLILLSLAVTSLCKLILKKHKATP